nr:hypothetical protein B0A51_13776 [Rachicladosporium sp. CCFEE 5018]
MPATSAQHQLSATLCVSDITELLEYILLATLIALPGHHGINLRWLFRVQRVNGMFARTISGSTQLRIVMFLAHSCIATVGRAKRNLLLYKVTGYFENCAKNNKLKSRSPSDLAIVRIALVRPSMLSTFISPARNLAQISDGVARGDSWSAMKVMDRPGRMSLKIVSFAGYEDEDWSTRCLWDPTLGGIVLGLLKIGAELDRAV